MTLSPGAAVDGPTALATLAPHLRGCVPASLGRRAAARALDFVLGTLVGFVVSLPLRSASSINQVMTLGLASQAVVAVITVGVYVYLGRTGYLPGGKLLGIRQVRLADGRSPGWAGVLKYLLIALVTGVTLGVGYLVTVLLIRKPVNQAWHDRVTGLVVLDVRAGRDPATPVPAAPVAAVAPAPAISLVGLDAAPPAPPAPSTGGWGFPETTQATMLGTVPPVPRVPAPAPTAPASAPVSVVGSEFGLITAVPGRSPRTSEPSSAPEPAAPVEPPVAPPAPVAPAGIVEENEDHTLLAPNALAMAPSELARALVADDGERISIDRVVVVGRNPTAPPDYPEARLVALRDPSMSTSKTHAVLRPDPDGIWVMDLHSTNGSSVTTPSGIRTAVPAGGALVVATGGQLHLGRRSFRVVGG